MYTYTTAAQRPLAITEARLHRDDGTDTPLRLLTRDEWMRISNKDLNGTPTCVYYDPQLDNGVLNIWPRPDYVSQYIKATARVPIQDFDTAANDPDFPQECYRAVKFNLAVDLSHEYTGIDLNRFDRVKRQADKLYATLVMADADYGSVYFKAYDGDF